jgi:molybdopterin converting factor small subunit
MALQLLLAATLRKYVSDYDAATGYTLQVEPGLTVRQIVQQLKIPEQEVKLILIDGIGSKWDAVLQGDERLALFPPVGGG